MRYCLALLLMVLFSFQVLPVKKIGKLIGKVQGTEQVQDDDDSSDDDVSISGSVCNGDIIISQFSFDCTAQNGKLESNISIFIRESGVLPTVQLAKIPSPPPEC